MAISMFFYDIYIYIYNLYLGTFIFFVYQPIYLPIIGKLYLVKIVFTDKFLHIQLFALYSFGIVTFIKYITLKLPNFLKKCLAQCILLNPFNK